MGLEIGTLRVRDVRAHEDARPGACVGVLVLGADGEAPYIGDVELTTKKSGHAEHVALVCPCCGRPKALLYVKGGALACAACSRTRTRHQKERTLAAWRRAGGREEDRLLRLARRRAPVSKMRPLVDELVEGDRDRIAVLLDSFHDVVILTEECHGTR